VYQHIAAFVAGLRSVEDLQDCDRRKQPKPQGVLDSVVRERVHYSIVCHNVNAEIARIA